MADDSAESGGSTALFEGIREASLVFGVSIYPKPSLDVTSSEGVHSVREVSDFCLNLGDCGVCGEVRD